VPGTRKGKSYFSQLVEFLCHKKLLIEQYGSRFGREMIVTYVLRRAGEQIKQCIRVLSINFQDIACPGVIQ
jgi:hypothetical protein